MKSFPGKALLLTILCSAITLLTGCGHLFKPAEDDPKALKLLGRLLTVNSTLTQYKGVANIQMQLNGRVHKGRIAFAAVQPDKMRVELLNMLGTPLTSLSGDGNTVTIISHGDQKRYHFEQTRTVLEILIKIPIGIEDLQNLLAGRVPIPPHALVKSPAGDGGDQDAVVLLKNRWHGLVAILQLDSQAQQIHSMRVIGPEGKLQYQVSWIRWREVGGYSVPAKLIIESPDKQKMTVSVDRYWPNAKVPPSTFVLESAKKNRS